MKQKLIILIVFILMAALLVGLNAATYTQKEKSPDSEVSPNRSSYNSGPTGTQAFYTLLSETNRTVVRWQEPADVLNTRRGVTPTTFVMVGPVRRKPEESEISGLLRWVSNGGRLVIIDREPTDSLVTTSSNWDVEVVPEAGRDIYEVDPSDVKSMTLDTPATKTGQPTVFTSGINAVQPSRFASSIRLERFDSESMRKRGTGISASPTPDPDEEYLEETPPQPPRPNAKVDPNKSRVDPNDDKLISSPTPLPVQNGDVSVDAGPPESPGLNAPLVHVDAGGKNILVDMPYGAGRIVVLSDPYIVSNGGIAMADNAKLAVNLVASGDGTIAFDEYHQGFGSNSNRLLEFFAGTPVVAIFIQCIVLLGLVFYSQSRRFARPLPDAGKDRLSKLEYVAAMAELQQRTRAFDLAVENIYRDFRRRAARLLGVDNQTVSREEFAGRISERSGLERSDINELLFKCDEIIAGEPTNRSEVVGLISRLREMEYRLGLRKHPVE